MAEWYVSPNRIRTVAHAEAPGWAGLFDATNPDAPAGLRESFADGMNLSWECAGKHHGTAVRPALQPRPVEISASGMILRDIRLKGVNCFPVTSWPRIISFGRLPVEKIVSGEIALSSAIDGGFETLLDPARGHVKLIAS